jgi:hypothetical protein
MDPLRKSGDGNSCFPQTSLSLSLPIAELIEHPTGLSEVIEGNVVVSRSHAEFSAK